MYKNGLTKRWETDIRRTGAARLHLDLGTAAKTLALAYEQAVVRLYQGKHYDLVERVRSGELTPQLLHDHFVAGGTVAELRSPAFTVSPWPSVADAVAQYVGWVQSNPKKSAGTAIAVERQLARWMDYLDTTPSGRHAPLDAIGAGMVTAYQAHLLASGAATNTITAYVSRVGTLYRWHRTREDRDSADAKRTPRVLRIPLDVQEIHNARARRDRYLSEDEAERLLAATPEPLLCVVMLGLFGGLRIGEALHLRTGFDVDLERGLLVIQAQPGWTPKTKRAARYVPIAQELRPVLERQLARRSSEEWVTPAMRNPTLPFKGDTFDQHFARIVAEAEMVPGRTSPDGVTFHTLRHTFASWLVMRGVDLYTVAQLLGDRVQQLEDTYAHLAPDFRQRAVDRLAGAVRVPTLIMDAD